MSSAARVESSRGPSGIIREHSPSRPSWASGVASMRSSAVAEADDEQTVPMTDDPKVGGLSLPHSLASALECGVWTESVEPSVLDSIFPHEPDAPSTPRFYSLDEMRGMSTPDPDPVYLGIPPDDLDPTAWIWIGELAIDRPFALDFRSAPPRVCFLTVPGRWIEIAESVDTLLVRLRKN
jgi:hypothetical protein